MQTYAAIDIGSNSCRLKIARVQQHQLKVLHEDREVTRLGASVFESGVISPEAIRETLSTFVHPDGGWGYAIGQPPHLEPTCLAILALAAEATK